MVEAGSPLGWLLFRLIGTLTYATYKLVNIHNIENLSSQEFFPRRSQKMSNFFLKTENWSTDENSDTGLITKSVR